MGTDNQRSTLFHLVTFVTLLNLRKAHLQPPWLQRTSLVGRALSLLATPRARRTAAIMGGSQLWVKAAVSVMGPFMMMETGLVVPEKEPVPLPVQLPKL